LAAFAGDGVDFFPRCGDERPGFGLNPVKGQGAIMLFRLISSKHAWALIPAMLVWGLGCASAEKKSGDDGPSLADQGAVEATTQDSAEKAPSANADSKSAPEKTSESKVEGDKEGHGTGHGGGHHQELIPHHKFDDVEKYAKRWDSPKRDAWQQPEKVLAVLALPDHAHVADIGAGTGYFALRFAETAKAGQVYAIDIEEKMLGHIEKRAAEAGLKNIKTVLATTADPKIPEPVDVIFLSNTYHHIEKRAAYFQDIKKHLRTGGVLVIVDFKVDKKIPVGPPPAMRVSPEQLHKELSEGGFARLKVDAETLPHQYIAIYTPVN
jgi:ubiquinone/menaquinone biosynthesis C-methylase UbiE